MINDAAKAKLIDADRGAKLASHIRPLASFYSGLICLFFLIAVVAPFAILASDGNNIRIAGFVFREAAWYVLLGLICLWIPKRLLALVAALGGLTFFLYGLVLSLGGLFTLALDLSNAANNLPFGSKNAIVTSSLLFVSGVLFCAISLKLILFGLLTLFSSSDVLKMAFLPIPPIYRPDRLFGYVIGLDSRHYLGRGLPVAYSAIIFPLRLISGAGAGLVAFSFLAFPAVLTAWHELDCSSQPSFIPYTPCRILDEVPGIGAGDAYIIFFLTLTMGGLVAMGIASWSSLIFDGLSNSNAEARRKKDGRPGILFLRSFSDDRVIISRSRMIQFISFRRRPIDLDELLESRFGGFGPNVALGYSAGRQIGASRIETDDASWQQKVIEEVGSARLIVLVIGNSTGVLWEMKTIIETGALQKTFLVVPPNLSLAGLFEFVGRFPELSELLLAERNANRAIGLFFYQNKPIVFVGSKRNSEAFEAIANYVCKFALKNRFLDAENSL